MDYTDKIYARPDASGTVVKLFSSAFPMIAGPQDGDVFVEEGREDYHRHVHLKYALRDEQGRYNYRIAERTAEDGTAPLIVLEEIPEGEKPPLAGVPYSPAVTQEQRIDAMEAAILEMAGAVYG